MQIALAQVNLHIGNFDYNTSKHIAFILEAASKGVDLVVFPELSVCGYPPQDLLELPDFIEACKKSIDAIARSCKGIMAIVGAPVENPSSTGKPLYNAALVLYEGKIIHTVYKRLLPNYDVFDESRYFEPGAHTTCLAHAGKKIGITICEDLWEFSFQPGTALPDNRRLYGHAPLHFLQAENPDFIINISSSPFSYLQSEARKIMLRKNAEKYGLPFIYVNQCGAHADLIFDGNSMVCDAKGEILKEGQLFCESLIIHDFDNPVSEISDASGDTEKIYAALVFGIREFFSKMGFTKAILGLSGGIDSAVTLVLACKALGAENVLAVMMPSAFSSSHSIEDSKKLIANLGCQSETLPIHQVVSALEHTLSDNFMNTSFGLAEENLQSRARGILLMGMANKHGYILLNTTNKSEAAVGYGTLYGDMCGALSVLGDVYKTRVYALARYINASSHSIPSSILTKEPSAELRPGQKDSDSLPPYEVLDEILEMHIEKRLPMNQIVKSGFDHMLVKKIIRMVQASEFKRYQMAPVLRISAKAFGYGRRMPLVEGFNPPASSSE